VKLVKVAVAGKAGWTESDTKRFYIPDVVLTAKCPECHAPWEMNLSDEYFSYPTFNDRWVRVGYCQNEDDCGVEFEYAVRINITVEPA